MVDFSHSTRCAAGLSWNYDRLGFSVFFFSEERSGWVYMLLLLTPVWINFSGTILWEGVVQLGGVEAHMTGDTPFKALRCNRAQE